jgi:Ca-activated chloride channel family protein
MKYCKILIVVLAAIVLCAAGSERAAIAEETGSITGKVVCSETDSALAYANVIVLGTNMGAMSLKDGKFAIRGLPPGEYTVKAMMMGYAAVEKKNVVVRAGEATEVNFKLDGTLVMKTQRIVITAEKKMVEVTASDCRAVVSSEQLMEMPCDRIFASADGVVQGDAMYVRGGRCDKTKGQFNSAWLWDPLALIRKPQQPWNTESYDLIQENEFLEAIDNPFSTFSIDVDAASYANTRRYINNGGVPPADAVRIEELINYFTYDYPEPKNSAPFSITADMTRCPWSEDNRLVRIGLQGKHIDLEKAAPNNLVFLLDVSGSMQPANKLPLLKKSFKLLVENLREEDRVAIVVYAGAAGLVLESTPGDEKEKIVDALDLLHAGGTTAGGAGIKLAYKVAEESFIKEGNNRVILATDGDFNTGVSSDAEMTRLIEEKRESGVFITVLGFGHGNLKDSKMEKIADHGNGHYAYIDNYFEGKRVMVNQLGGTLYTIAKDVKIQVEFNPARVQSYRLIGYENRMLKKEDFDDDKKDAGEIGAGHSVTALYEVEPAKKQLRANARRKSKYTTVSVDESAFETDELLTVRFRYKAPDGDESELIEQTLAAADVGFEDAPEEFRFAAAVAEWGMLLRDSQFKGDASYGHVLRTARQSTGNDEGGYRHEFVRLVEKSKDMADE